MSVNILPEGWVSVTLADICSKPQYGYTTKSQLDGNVKFLRTTDITKGILNWDSVPYCEDPPTDLYKYQLYDRDIVISRAGSIGFSALIKNPPKKVVFASYLIRFKPSEFISEVFIKYFLNSHDYWTQLRLMSAGNAVQNVNAQKLSILNVPLPPLAEQKIIADKLDDLLARVESIKTRLENIPEILKKFRQSVLSAAVSGKLTEEWRVEKEEPISDLLKEIITDQKVAIKNKRVKKNFGNHNIVRPLFDLPDSCWEWVCFPQISETNNNALKAGPFGSALKKSDCVGDGYKVYGQEQVISGQENIETYRVTESKFEELKSCMVKPGDVLISLVGTIGKVLILSSNAEVGIINPRLVKISLHEKISREYIEYYLGSPFSYYFFKSFSHGGTMEILNLSILKELPIPLPPISEQHEIVRRVKSFLVRADSIEKSVSNTLKRINNLTQSILAKAFRGELTAQWREENSELISGLNSAEALLEKITAEKLAAGTIKKRAKKSSH
ncbi:restriction endonuclease subunit S [Klebsiella pneumoniae]|uniref:restriction endonuclease subunit S n=1 Tax=Klebsiella pneumoniae TaxID=573 RepID=UPI0003BF18A8|nr:restriction endonuclease subunit S [Klebsiella pneumoniae]EIW8500414.1 restriction endonuclease subunit S [Klebsiella pneumoniae]ESL47893.1 hypothetical protein L460_04755 [Klebsiella pneumoniae BIDMC 24]KAB7533302.1 restriction endonuclease subunit S [Klebsiella pneumoniae]MBS2827017.1 restriction endonuclease subunit S [Klebsiella pneumoniae]MBW5926443.1 restriction endonuclease subunit S [Klebsiella pneumoniae]